MNLLHSIRKVSTVQNAGDELELLFIYLYGFTLLCDIVGQFPNNYILAHYLSVHLQYTHTYCTYRYMHTYIYIIYKSKYKKVGVLPI